LQSQISQAEDLDDLWLDNARRYSCISHHNSARLMAPCVGGCHCLQAPHSRCYVTV